MLSEQAKSSQSSCGKPKKQSSTIAPISLEHLMDKEMLSSSQDGDISWTIGPIRSFQREEHED